MQVTGIGARFGLDPVQNGSVLLPPSDSESYVFLALRISYISDGYFMVQQNA
jgi:hypothetical protein